MVCWKSYVTISILVAANVIKLTPSLLMVVLVHRATSSRMQYWYHVVVLLPMTVPLIVLRDKELYTIGVGLISLDGEYVKRWGHIMAAYVVASIPLILLFLFTMKLFIKGLSAGAVKG